MKARLSLLPLLVGLTLSCQSEQKLCHRDQLEELGGLLSEHRYTDALAEMDSLLQEHPTDTAVLRCVTQVKKHIRYREAEHKLLVIDSQLTTMDERMKALLKDFVIKQNTEYNTTPRYLHRSMEQMEELNYSHLRLLFSAKEIAFISVYVGDRAINHDAMRVSFGEPQQSYETPVIPYDKALNYRYHDGLRHREFVNYSHQVGEELLRFMQERMAEGARPRIELLSRGRSVAQLSLSASQVEAIRESVELGAFLQERNELLLKQDVYARRYARLAPELRD